MQVNSISADKSAFKAYYPSREELEAFANLDKATLKNAAIAKTSVEVNDKKHRRVTNAIWASIPVAAGLAEVVRNPQVIGRLPKLGVFAGTMASWAATFALVDATFGGKRLLERHSQKANEFNKKHPVAANLLAIGVSIGAMILGGKAVSKLADKQGANVINWLKKHKVAKFLENTKIIGKPVELFRKLPSAIKSFTKGVISWSPYLLIATSIGHSFNHERVRAERIAKNYEDLKDNQAMAREYLMASDEV